MHVGHIHKIIYPALSSTYCCTATIKVGSICRNKYLFLGTKLELTGMTGRKP